jgi:hypothetical protein
MNKEPSKDTSVGSAVAGAKQRAENTKMMLKIEKKRLIYEKVLP